MFQARLLVYPSPSPLNMAIRTHIQTPTESGDVLYIEAAWENESKGAGRHWTFGLPVDLALSARVSGQNVFSFDEIYAPAILPTSFTQHFTIGLVPTQRPDTLVFTALIMRNENASEPSGATVDIQAGEARLLDAGRRTVQGEMGVYYLSQGDFDGAESTRVRLGVTDVAQTSIHKEFRTSNHTLIIGAAVLDGTADHGAGSIRLHLQSSRDEYNMTAGGGLDRPSQINPFIAKEYGDTWKLDAEFFGEGYLLLAYADFPTKEFKDGLG